MSYLLEIRLGGDPRRRIHDIANIVARRFPLRQPDHYVPHITLLGPYRTDAGVQIKKKQQAVCEQYRVLPFIIDGFDTFSDANVLYANVTVSDRFREFRRELVTAVWPFIDDAQPYDRLYWYDYHVTLGWIHDDEKLAEAKRFCEDHVDLYWKTYATRMTALRNREMMWEWDLPTQRELRYRQATSRKAWERTEVKLDSLRSDDDHDGITPVTDIDPNRQLPVTQPNIARMYNWMKRMVGNKRDHIFCWFSSYVQLQHLRRKLSSLK